MNQVISLLLSMEQQPGFLMLTSAAAILAIATAVSGARSGFIRMIFYFVLAGIMFYLSNVLDALNGDFFLNVGVELLGAVLTFILLGDWVTRQVWLFPVIFLITVLSTLTVELSPAPLQSFFLNVSAQLVGTLLIIILVKKRSWFWSGRSKRPGKQMEQMRIRMMAQKDLYLEQWKTAELKKIHEEIEQEMRDWRAKTDHWNTAIKVAGTNKRDVQNKLKYLSNTLDNIEILKVDEGDDVVQCYVVGTIVSKP
jgi:DNA segregation ATPase FtsK/SpoIIIE-like protein